ncbi:MAG: hypothetical protein KBS55_02520 [Bacteroidales bacterium]|nr:hypothetical protein [Candidatus Cryptobacteroides aphodequi]
MKARNLLIALDYWGDTFDFSVKVAGSNASPDSLCFVLDLDAKLAGKKYSAVNSFNTFEGLFDKDNHLITIPKGQVFSRREGYLEGYGLNGWNDADPHVATSANEDILISVKPDCSEITILNAFGTQKQGTTNWTTIYAVI